MTKNLKVNAEYGVNMDWDKLDDWQKQAHPWTVKLQYDRRQMTVPFFMGPALDHEPTDEDVMPALVSDYYCVAHTRNFNDFCDELGYDPDSRKAEQIYKQCMKQAGKLETLFGPDLPEILDKYGDM